MIAELHVIVHPFHRPATTCATCKRGATLRVVMSDGTLGTTTCAQHVGAWVMRMSDELLKLAAKRRHAEEAKRRAAEQVAA